MTESSNQTPPDSGAEPRRHTKLSDLKAEAPMGFSLLGFAAATRRTRSMFREISMILSVLRAPALVSLLGSVVFAFPGQTYEVYRLMAEDFQRENTLATHNIRFYAFFVMLYVTCYALWYMARILTLIDEHAKHLLVQSETGVSAARWAPRLIGAMPAFAAAFGMARAEYSRTGVVSTEGLYGAAAVAAVIGLHRLWASWRRTRHDPMLYANLRASWLRIDVRLALTVVLVAGVGYMLSQPIWLSQIAGTLPIFCFFLIALVFGWSQLTYLYDQYSIPGVTVLIGAMLLWSALDLNDNHFIRSLDMVKPRMVPVGAGERQAAARVQALDAASGAAAAPAAAPEEKLMNLEQAFNDWYRSRADRLSFELAGKPYPVYVIAAQGGGLYAAYQTAMFLARLQDSCPNFAQHVFAISGVSGGAVGASIFTGQIMESGQNRPVSDDAPCGEQPSAASGQLEQQVDAMLREDFLSPVVSGLLFGDFTAQFSPVAIPSFDRARALESAFERAWRQGESQVEEQTLKTLQDRGEAAAPSLDEAGTNPLTNGLLSYWSPLGAAPILMMNTTEAETGQRMVLSPIPDLGTTLRSYAKVVERDAEGRIPDMRLSTAMVLSARFPYITPAASLRVRPEGERDYVKLRLVDGGYFENSGIETAFDITRELGRRLSNRRFAAGAAGRAQALPADRRAERIQRLTQVSPNRADIDFRMIFLDLTEDRFQPPSYALGELLSPVKAILNSRVSRAQLAQERTRRQFRSPCRYILSGGAPQLGDDVEDAMTLECPYSDVRAGQVWSVSLNDYEYDFQLGWLLSRDTLDRIRTQIGEASACKLDVVNGGGTLDPTPETLGDGGDARNDKIRRHNSCIGRFIIDQLRREG